MAVRSSSTGVELHRGCLRRAARRGERGEREGEGEVLTTSQNNNSISKTRKTEKKNEHD